MGAADLVPGVSGGTIAFISGIYDELISTIAGLGMGTLRDLFRGGPIEVWKKQRVIHASLQHLNSINSCSLVVALPNLTGGVHCSA